MRVTDILNTLGQVQYLLDGPITRAEHEAYRDEAKEWTGFPAPMPIRPEEKRRVRAMDMLAGLYTEIAQAGIIRLRLPDDLPFTSVRVPSDEDGGVEFLDSYADRWEFRLLRNKQRYCATYYVTRQVQPEAIPYAMGDILRTLIKEIKGVEG